MQEYSFFITLYYNISSFSYVSFVIVNLSMLLRIIYPLAYSQSRLFLIFIESIPLVFSLFHMTLFINKSYQRLAYGYEYLQI